MSFVQLLAYLLVNGVRFLLMALEICMMLRAILSWFIMDGESPLMNFLLTVTEPLIFPVRCLLDRFEAVRNMPIDISFIVTYFLLVLLQYLLP